MELIWFEEEKGLWITSSIFIDFIAIREFFCWHQWYADDIRTFGNYKSDWKWCLHCGKWARGKYKE